MRENFAHIALSNKHPLTVIDTHLQVHMSTIGLQLNDDNVKVQKSTKRKTKINQIRLSFNQQFSPPQCRCNYTCGDLMKREFLIHLLMGAFDVHLSNISLTNQAVLYNAFENLINCQQNSGLWNVIFLFIAENII